MKLRWIKINHGIWVDRDGFYCIRRQSCSPRPPHELLSRPLYRAWETYPGLPVEAVGTGFDLAAAKAICQARSDRVLGDAA